MAPAAGRYMSITKLHNLEGHTGTMSSEDHVRNLNNASRAWRAHLNDGYWIVVVGKPGASAHDLRPNFANDLGTSGDADRIRDNVSTGVEEDDLATRELGKDVFDCCGVVSVSIALKFVRFFGTMSP